MMQRYRLNSPLTHGDDRHDLSMCFRVEYIITITRESYTRRGQESPISYKFDSWIGTLHEPCPLRHLNRCP